MNWSNLNSIAPLAAFQFKEMRNEFTVATSKYQNEEKRELIQNKAIVDIAPNQLQLVSVKRPHVDNGHCYAVKILDTDLCFLGAKLVPLASYEVVMAEQTNEHDLETIARLKQSILDFKSPSLLNAQFSLVQSIIDQYTATKSKQLTACIKQLLSPIMIAKHEQLLKHLGKPGSKAKKLTNRLINDLACSGPELNEIVYLKSLWRLGEKENAQKLLDELRFQVHLSHQLATSQVKVKTIKLSADSNQTDYIRYKTDVGENLITIKKQPNSNIMLYCYAPEKTISTNRPPAETLEALTKQVNFSFEEWEDQLSSSFHELLVQSLANGQVIQSNPNIDRIIYDLSMLKNVMRLSTSLEPKSLANLVWNPVIPEAIKMEYILYNSSSGQSDYLFELARKIDLENPCPIRALIATNKQKFNQHPRFVEVACSIALNRHLSSLDSNIFDEDYPERPVPNNTL